MNLASLPMYDLPELTDATNAWWDGLARHMQREGVVDVPEVLTRPQDVMRHWLSPNLLLSQTCGYPLTHLLRSKVQLVGLPVYACDGCTGDGFYSSVIIAPASSKVHALHECRQPRAVFNTSDSMSGMLALRLAAGAAASAAAEADNGDGESGFFSSFTQSGSHRNSMRAVARGEADVAAIDAVTFALLKRFEPDSVRKVRKLGYTRQVPGLPLITSVRTSDKDLARMQAALRAAMKDPELAHTRAELMLRDITFPMASSYDVILRLEADAADVPPPS